MSFWVLETLAPPPSTTVPAGQDALTETPLGALVASIEAVVATFVTFEIAAEVAFVAFVALVAFVAVSADDACVALGTVPSEPSLILLPGTEPARSRFPESEFFLINESPLVKLVAATAVPDAATTSAMTATTMAAEGLRCLRRVMAPLPSVFLPTPPWHR
jgi:hypothetical protein